MKKWTTFRKWVHDLWNENCDEHRECGETPYPVTEYFQKYKYWLKREFKFQRKTHND